MESENGLSVNEAITAVIQEVPDGGIMGAAKVYARAALRAAVEYGTEGLKVQVRYILCNLGGWRGDRAREVKAALRDYLKETKGGVR